MLKFLKNIFADKPREHTSEAKLFTMGYDALKMARKLDLERNNTVALSYYDIAVNCGFEEAYQSRALILQGLDYDLEAIEDFNKAIAISPEDPNLFFGRHLSKSKTGDFDGAIKDIEKAVSLSKIPNRLNREYDDEMQQKGYEDATQFFETWLVRAIADADSTDNIKGLRKLHLNRRTGNLTM